MSALTPYTCVTDAKAAITWYADAFGCRWILNQALPEG
jgi:uncharacterized glyoxalase superfamily protein PhnB